MISASSDPKPAIAKHEWSAHFWEGCDALAWWRMLAANRFAVHWSKLYVAASVTGVSIGHTVLRIVQNALLGETVRRTAIRYAPLFIIGHWRCGTTLLHELLITDPRHSYPTTYECLAPHHFLLTESWLPPWVKWMMPKRRPMDNIPAGWDRPQEDEFALCLLGVPSPYSRIAFPNRRPDHDDGSLDLSGLSPAARRNWMRVFDRFIRELTVLKPDGRLILKSPPHSCRIPTLLELFPDARFVHIVRDPYETYTSTIKLWRALYVSQGLQRPTFDGLEEYVLRTFEHMYERLRIDRKLIRDDRWFELKYEDLLCEPVGLLEGLYSKLELGSFALARRGIETYLVGTKNYTANRHVLSDPERDTITQRWGDVIRRYGYPIRTDHG